MKQTGIVRKVDELGRVTIPKELRTAMNMHEGQSVEILTDGDSVILRQYTQEHACIITGQVTDKNMYFAGGKVVLSPAGLGQLIKELGLRGISE